MQSTAQLFPPLARRALKVWLLALVEKMAPEAEKRKALTTAYNLAVTSET